MYEQWLKNTLKIYKNQLTETIKNVKQNSARNLISKNKNKALWNCVNKLCNKTLQKTHTDKN